MRGQGAGIIIRPTPRRPRLLLGGYSSSMNE